LVVLKSVVFISKNWKRQREIKISKLA